MHLAFFENLEAINLGQFSDLCLTTVFAHLLLSTLLSLYLSSQSSCEKFKFFISQT